MPLSWCELAASGDAWLGFAYLSVISMFLGFFAWYAGLARGGVARIGQVQLTQPLLTFAWSALLLGERLTPVLLVAMRAASAHRTGCWIHDAAPPLGVGRIRRPSAVQVAFG